MLKSLDMTNFKCHEQAHIDFDPRLTLITGNNYKGKTSILQGILFALWGPGAVPGGKSRIIRRGAKRCLVDLQWLEADGAVLRIERSMSTAKLFRNDELIASSASAVGAELNQILGLDNKLFMRLKYGAQGEAQAMLTLGGLELHKTIERVCGIDTVTSMLELLRARLSENKGALEARGEIDVAPMTERREELKVELVQVRDQHAVLEKQLPDARSGLAAARAAELEAAAYNSEVARQKDRWAMLERSVRDDARQHATALQVRGKSRADLILLQAQHKPLSEEMLRKVEAAGQDKRRIDLLDGQMAAQVDTLKIKRAACTKLQSELDRLGAPADIAADLERVATMTSQAHVLFDRLEQLNTAESDGVCPTCHRPFEGYDAQEHAARKAELTEEYSRLQDELTNLSDASGITQQRNSSIAGHAADLVRGEHHVAQLEEQSREWEKQAATLRGDHDWIKVEALEKQARGQESTGREIALTTKLIEQQDSRLETLDLGLLRDRTEMAELKAESSDPLNMADFRHAHEQWQSHVDTLLSASSGHRSRISLLEERCKHYDHALGEMALAQAAIDELNVERDLITRLGLYLKENKERFLGDVWERVLALAGTFASSATEGYIEGLTRTESGQFNYLEGGEACTVAEASGAQKSLLGVGLQVAMAQMLPSPWQTLLLDEPTANMDEDHALACTALLTASNAQLVVVSHRALDAAVAGTVVEL